MGHSISNQQTRDRLRLLLTIRSVPVPIYISILLNRHLRTLYIVYFLCLYVFRSFNVVQIYFWRTSWWSLPEILLVVNLLIQNSRCSNNNYGMEGIVRIKLYVEKFAEFGLYAYNNHYAIRFFYAKFSNLLIITLQIWFLIIFTNELTY